LAAPSAPPSGPIDPVAEYEPMEGLVVSWMSFPDILAQIGRRVTVEGNGRYYVGVTGFGSSTVANATSWLNTYSADLNKVTFFTVPLNSIWVRDYGPRYVFEGDVRVITDHQYNRPRPSDDQQPVAFGQLKQNKYYEIGINNTTLIHGGGNYHLDALGDAYSTQLIVNENPLLTPSQIQQVWNTYQNNNTTITSVFPSNIDATGHIDMWMQIYDDNKVFISDWPTSQGSVQDQICEATASLMQSRGYQVTRIPAYSIGGVHYTFTNMVIFNDVVMLPQYNNGPGAAVSNQVLATVQAAFGAGKTVYQINGDPIVPLAGVFHCIVQHIPAHKGLAGANGGLAPTAYLRGPNDGQTLEAGQQYQIQWITDDDAPVAAQGGVQGVDILLSTDGGQNFNTTIATNQPALGSLLWTVPSGIFTTDARIRIVARDGVANTGFDDSDLDFTITDPAIPVVGGSEFAFATAPQRISFAFSQDVAASLGTDDIVLENLTTSQTIPGADLNLSYNAGTNTATFTYTGAGEAIAGVLPDGNYRATLLAVGITNAGGTPLPADHVFNFFFLNGDADRDGRVNLNDFNVLAANFGQNGTDFTRADFDFDGVTNLNDFNVLAGRFGVVLASPSGWASLFGNHTSADSARGDDAVTDLVV
jgi:agmatine/peptidylarginine deiminase